MFKQYYYIVLEYRVFSSRIQVACGFLFSKLYSEYTTCLFFLLKCPYYLNTKHSFEI